MIRSVTRLAGEKRIVVVVPVGATLFHRRTSVTTALIYGRSDWSENPGSLPSPITASSSAWAFF